MELILEILATVFAAILALVPANTLSYEAIFRPTPPPSAHVLFAGDIMLDRSIRAASDEKGGDYIFSCIADTLASSDIVVANLEGPITSSPSRSLGSAPRDANNFTFTFPTSSAELLYRHNIRIVNLGNNHITNFGQGGVTETKEWLTAAGVQYFGDPTAAADATLRTEIGNVQFSFVSWSEWTGATADETVAQIRTEAAAGRIVVVYTHWGDEYVKPPKRVVDLAHRFVDAGAEIVIGSHPHVIQESEEYSGKMIYYSLGNFVFDQYWNENVRTGLFLSVTFGKDGVTETREIPVYLERDRRTCLKAAE